MAKLKCKNQNNEEIKVWWDWLDEEKSISFIFDDDEDKILQHKKIGSLMTCIYLK